MATGVSEYEMEWVQDEVRMGWSGYRIKMQLVQETVDAVLNGYRMKYGVEWVQD